MSDIILSILIPTVLERADQFDKLRQHIICQLMDYDLEDDVELLHIQDNKEMTIGEKRNKLYRKAKGMYSLQVDDDDWLHPQAIPLIVNELRKYPDCVGYKELCIYDGKRVESSNFSKRYGGWADNVDGFNHVRTPFFKTPIKTRICLQCPIPAVRFGEDHEFAKAIYPLIETEQYIDEFIYIYQHNSTPHNERYGITNNL